MDRDSIQGTILGRLKKMTDAELKKFAWSQRKRAEGPQGTKLGKHMEGTLGDYMRQEADLADEELKSRQQKPKPKPTALTGTKKGLARFHELQGEYYNESAQRVKDYKKVSYSDLPKGLVKALKSQFSQSIDQFGTEKNPKNPGTTTRKTEYALEKLIGGLDRAKKQGFLSFDLASGDKIQVSEKVARQIIQNDLSSVVWSKHIDKNQKYFNLSDTGQTELRSITGEALPALDSETGYRGKSGRLGRHTDTQGTVDTHFDTQPGNLKKQEGYFLGEEGEGRSKEPYFETDDPNVRYSGTKTKEGLVQVPKKQKSILELKLSDIVDPEAVNLRESMIDKMTRGPKSPQSGFASETRLASIDPKVAIGESGADLDLERESFAQDMESRLKDTKPKGYEVGGPNLGEKVKTGKNREMPKSTLLTAARRAGHLRRQARLKSLVKVGQPMGQYVPPEPGSGQTKGVVKSVVGNELLRRYQVGELMVQGRTKPPVEQTEKPKKISVPKTSMGSAEPWDAPTVTNTEESSNKPYQYQRPNKKVSRLTSVYQPPLHDLTIPQEHDPSPKQISESGNVKSQEVGEWSKKEGPSSKKSKVVDWTDPFGVKRKIFLGMPYLGLGLDIIHGLKTKKEAEKSGKKFTLRSFIPPWANKIAFGEGIPRS